MVWHFPLAFGSPFFPALRQKFVSACLRVAPFPALRQIFGSACLQVAPFPCLAAKFRLRLTSGRSCSLPCGKIFSLPLTFGSPSVPCLRQMFVSVYLRVAPCSLPSVNVRLRLPSGRPLFPALRQIFGSACLRAAPIFPA